TGPYQRPVMPAPLADDPTLFQVHASGYRAPAQLPAGAVLVVGSGASGAQIAEELARAGRRVFLSVGRHKRMPRRYRGRDLMWWLAELGLDQTPAARRGPDKTLPLITGAYGGPTNEFPQLAKPGAGLVGRGGAARERHLTIASDLGASLAAGDRAYLEFLDKVDAHVRTSGLELPEEAAARIVGTDPPCVREPVNRLDLHEEGIASVIWATGYAFDFGWI